MVALSGGHCAADFASGSVPALIPFLTDRFNLSYTLAAVILLAATVSSSLVQPAFGFWSDRAGALWLIPAGVALAAVGVGGAAVSPAYPVVVLLVFVGGLGVAAFHPEGAKVASFASGEKRASGMSYFNIGGNLGYALGAFATGLIVAQVGLRGGVLAMIPVLLAAGRPDARPAVPRHARPGGDAARAHRERRGPAAGDGAPRRDHRPPQHRLVRRARLRAAVGRGARPLEGGRKPPAVPDAALGRNRHDPPRPGRGCDRVEADPRRSRRSRSRR